MRDDLIRHQSTSQVRSLMLKKHNCTTFQDEHFQTTLKMKRAAGTCDNKMSQQKPNERQRAPKNEENAARARHFFFNFLRLGVDEHFAIQKIYVLAVVNKMFSAHTATGRLTQVKDSRNESLHRNGRSLSKSRCDLDGDKFAETILQVGRYTNGARL